ncbi:MAG: NAD(P)-dependent oxidoreductase [Gemmatimonadaceae bacterium]|nr:NAD(P)-dependent oxidoreductase [Gemmatimonadaceae bacterium]
MASTTSTKRIFVTGATGVVGTHVVPLLIAQGHDVSAVGRSAEKRARLESLGARGVELDVFDEVATRTALAGQDVVINLATHMPETTMQMMLPWKWRENDVVRREGSAALAHAAHDAGVRRFMQESFAPIYEDNGSEWIDESWRQRPASYNRTTLDAERSALSYTEQGGEGVVLRFAGFYGPDQFLRDAIGMVKKGWSPLPGSPLAYWSSIAHEDAASAVVALVGAPAGVYNVCDDTPITRAEWAVALAQAAEITKAPRPIPRFLAALGGASVECLSRSQRMSNAKLKAATGWSPKWASAREGLTAAVRSFAPR